MAIIKQIETFLKRFGSIRPTAVTFIRLSPNDRNIPQGAHLQFMKGFHNMNLLKETNIPFVEN